MSKLILIRHGETAWSRELKHTGRTDIPLTAAGEAAAAALAADLAARRIVAAFSSPAQRAMRTAELAGLTTVPSGLKTDHDLAEWDYGGYEGRTSSDIQRQRPGWYLWRDGVIPGDAGHPGETVGEVGVRADAVLARVRPLLAGRRRRARLARPPAPRADRPLARPRAPRRQAVPARHWDAVAARDRARRAGDRDLEPPAHGCLTSRDWRPLRPLAARQACRATAAGSWSWPGAAPGA